MKTRLEVEDRREAALIQRGLQDAQTRALVKVVGALIDLDRAEQRRALNYVIDKLNLDIEPIP